MSKLAAFISIAAGSLLVSTELSAHHGAGVYDLAKTISVTGKVTQFHFINPHVLIYIAVTDEDGSELEWSGELTSPNRLARMSQNGVQWHKDLLKVGDRITLTGNRARNGAPSLRLSTVRDAHGTALVGGGR